MNVVNPLDLGEVGTTFTIIDFVTSGTVTGTFAGLAEGSTVTGSDGSQFSITYSGGDGDNVDLMFTGVVPEPGDEHDLDGAAPCRRCGIRLMPPPTTFP